jgi:hypothetical protein
MATSPTVPMYAPDGTLGDIPYERMHDALQAGGKMAVNVLAPDGTKGVIPADRTQDAVKAGGKVIPYDLSDADGGKPGFWSHVKSSLSGMVPTQAPSTAETVLGPAATVAKQIYGAGQGAVAASQRGHGLPYSAAAGAATAVGVNVPRMEQAAEQGDSGGVLGEAAVPAAMAVAPSAIKGAGEIAGKVLPSASRAGAALQDVRASAGHIPIDMSAPGDTALQIYYEAKHGAYLPKPVNDLLKRMGLNADEMAPNNRAITYDTATNRGALDPNTPPLTYAEAKSFQSNISKLTAADKMSTNPNIKRLVVELNGKLKDSLENSAEVVGKGDQFTDAMNEYHKAMQIQGLKEDAIDALKTHIIKAVVTGAGMAGGGYALKKFLDNR